MTTTAAGVIWAGWWRVRAENIASRSLFTASGWRSEIAPRQRRGEWCYFVRG